jgi:microcystin-dependent protein
MASVAKYRDDVNGSISTGGTSTAYTLTSNQSVGITTYGVVALIPHTTNGATVTLNVDGAGAKPLRQAPGVELPAGVLVQGTPYTATYYTSNSGEWILHGFYGNTYGLQVGMGLNYLSSTAPSSNFALPFGQALNRTTYATLFSLIGTTFGVGDGTTTFNMPDVRGRLEAGLDNMGGSTAGRITNAGSGIVGTTIGATGGAETVTLSVSQLPVHTPTGSVSAPTINDAHFGDISVPTPGALVAKSSGGNSVGITANAPTFTGDPIGSGAAINKMPPVIILPKVYRII